MSTHRAASLLLALLLLLIAAPAPAVEAATGTVPYVFFRKQAMPRDFAAASRWGVTVRDARGRADVRLASTGLASGTNPGLYGTPKRYWYGRLRSPAYATPRAFDTAIASWNARTPPGTWIRVELRAYRPRDRHWTRYYTMGIWAATDHTIRRRSLVPQRDADGRVATDTLLLSGAPAYTRYQYRLTLFTTDRRVSPSVRLVGVVASDSEREPRGLAMRSDREAWGKELAVPPRSQMIYPEGGEVWCSPTSSSMVLAYWGRDVPVPRAAADTYDHAYRGHGNWPFNTAWAARYGYDASVTRLMGLAQAEEWISAGVPVVISLGWGRGELAGAPFAWSDGHIIVVRGFTAQGDVIANDPGGRRNAWVRRVYPRAQLERLWLRYSGGTAYLIYPHGKRPPTEQRYGSW